MATINAVGGPKNNLPTLNANANLLIKQSQKVDLPQPKSKAPKVEGDLQKFTEKLKQSFKELENMPSFPRNLLVKLDVGLEFGIFVLPEQLFSKLTDSDTRQTLKIQPPEFLLQHRVVVDRLIAEPAFQRVITGLLVNESA